MGTFRFWAIRVYKRKEADARQQIEESRRQQLQNLTRSEMQALLLSRVSAQIIANKWWGSSVGCVALLPCEAQGALRDVPIGFSGLASWPMQCQFARSTFALVAGLCRPNWHCLTRTVEGKNVFYRGKNIYIYIYIYIWSPPPHRTYLLAPSGFPVVSFS